MLPALDIFKASPTIRFRGNAGYSSRYGQIVTFLVVGMSIVLFMFLSKDMILKTNPIFSRVDSRLNEPLIINNSTFTFAFGLRLANGTFLQDEKIFQVRAITSRTNKFVELSSCKPIMFFNQYNSTSESEIYCISSLQRVGGELQIDFGDHLNINFYKCNNASSNNTCLTQETIDKTLEGSHIAIYYNDIIFDPSNFGKPLDVYPTSYKTSLMSGFIKQSILVLSSSNFEFDNTWIFRDSIQVSKVAVNTIKQFFEDFSAIPGVFKQISLQNSGITTNSKREYDKFPNVLAQWDAMIALLLLFGKFLTESFNNFKAHEELINDMFAYDHTYDDIDVSQFEEKGEKFISESKEKNSFALRLPEQRQESQSGTKDEIFIKDNVFEPQERENNSKDKKKSPYTSIFSPSDSKENLGNKNHSILVSMEQKEMTPATSIQSPRFIRYKQAIEEDKYNLDLIASISGLKIEQPDLNDSLVKLNESKINDLNDSKITIDPTNFKEHSMQVNTIDPVEQDLKKDQDQEPVSQETKSCGVNLSINKNENKSRTKALDIGFFTWLFSGCRKTQDYKTFTKREKMIITQFDYENLVKRFLEIDTLKYILLSSDQNALFEDCTKGLLRMKMKDIDKTIFKRQSVRVVPMVTNSKEIAYKNLVGVDSRDETTIKVVRLVCW